MVKTKFFVLYKNEKEAVAFSIEKSWVRQHFFLGFRFYHRFNDFLRITFDLQGKNYRIIMEMAIGGNIYR